MGKRIYARRLSLLAVSVILLMIYSGFGPSGGDADVEIAMRQEQKTESIYDIETITVLPTHQSVSGGDSLLAFSRDDWNLVLVNKQHSIAPDYPVKLGQLTEGAECDKRIIDDWYAMEAAAAKEGITIIVASPYRDYERQVYLFDKKVKTNMAKGLSYLEAYKQASQIVNIPGCSEHQTGLVFDIISDDYSKLNEGFAKTAAGKWLAAHCHEYGFILRYPKGKEYITSIDYEPWHFRYVGVEAATIIMEEGITLEEFIERLQ